MLSQTARKALKTAFLAVFSLQLAGCGYILYPDRRGQKGGQIDPVVAILDGAGVLLFIVPGLIAYIVDFSQGTIYLPAGKNRRAELLKFDPSQRSKELIADLVHQKTGKDAGLSNPKMHVIQVASVEEGRVILAGGSRN
jgi:hypothetical protein